MGFSSTDTITTANGLSATGFVVSIRGNIKVIKHASNGGQYYLTALVYYTMPGNANHFQELVESTPIDAGDITGDLYSAFYTYLKSSFVQTTDV